MISKLFVEKVNLVVQNFDTDQNYSFFVSTAADGFFFACLWILAYHMLMIINVALVQLMKEEWQENQVVIKVLHQSFVNIF